MTERKPEKYDPEIQGVIDRFIAGDIPVKDNRKSPKDRAVKVSQASWADSHDEAAEKLAKKKRAEANYYERLEKRGNDATRPS